VAAVRSRTIESHAQAPGVRLVRDTFHDPLPQCAPILPGSPSRDGRCLPVEGRPPQPPSRHRAV